MTRETYKFQYEKWHQDTKKSLHSDVKSFAEFIDLQGMQPKNKDAAIFDIGCGMGRLLLAFREKGYNNLGGIDVDEYQISIAQKEKLDVKLGDASRFFKRNKDRYHLVTMIDSLEHIEKDEQIGLLQKISRNLYDDGKLVIRVPNALSPTFAYYRYIDFTHTVSYTIESLTYVLKNAGFDYITFRPAWRENKEIIKLKKPFAELLKAEFGIIQPVLTANIVVVAFKSREALEEYSKSAPKLEVRY